MCRSYLLSAAEGCRFLEIGRTYCLTDKALFIRLGQVGRDLTTTLTGLQLLGKELLGSLKLVTLLSLLLVVDEVEIGVTFFLDGRTVEHIANLTNQQVGRTSVEQQVMNIHQQVYPARRLYHLEPIKRRLLQVKRLYELILVRRQCLIAHLNNRHLHGYAVCQSLHDGIALSGKMDA